MVRELKINQIETKAIFKHKGTEFLIVKIDQTDRFERNSKGDA